MENLSSVEDEDITLPKISKSNYSLISRISGEQNPHNMKKVKINGSENYKVCMRT
jgi:hypothetical protein